MLKIREQQLHALRDAQREREFKELAEQLRGCFPDRLAEYSTGGLQELVQQGALLAQRHGIFQMPDFRRFLGIVVQFGLDLETNPRVNWAGNILRRKGRTGSEKIEALEAYANQLGTSY